LISLKAKWNFEIIDLWNDEDMLEVSREDYEKYMRDPVHPTKLGYTQWWGPKFAAALKAALE